MSNRRQRQRRRKRLRAIEPSIQRAKQPPRSGRIAPKEVLDNNTTFDFELVFDTNSKSYPERQAEMRHFVDALYEKPCPKKLRPTIASGAKRAKQSWRNVETLLANVHAMKAKRKTSIAVSLSPNTYSGRRVNSGIINLYRLADHFGFIKLWPGYFNAQYRKQSRLARIEPKAKLWRLLARIDIKDALKKQPDDLVELRRTVKKVVTFRKHGETSRREIKKKEFVPRKDYEKNLTEEKREKLQHLRTSIEWFNIVLSAYRKTYTGSDGKEHVLNINLKAVYTDDFEHGGRLYTSGDGHQRLSKEERKTIRFNNLPTRELDYGGQHIRILYHLAGTSYPLKKDPYAAVLLALGKSPKQIKLKFGADFYEQVRNDLKVMLLALVNGSCKGRDPVKAAARRANWRLFREYEKIKKPEALSEKQNECKERKERWKQAHLLNSHNSCYNVLKAFHKAHKPISNYFSSGCGLRLQNIDAEIAHYVLCEMMYSNDDKSIPTLSIHDSFITFAHRKCLRKLYKAMKYVYRIVMQQETGRKENFKIPVKGYQISKNGKWVNVT